MTLSPRFEDALVFAARLHAGEVRKGTTIPYISHVLGVASPVLEHGAGEDEAIAVLLHDTVEGATGDPEVIRLEIRRRYGRAVLAIVDGCTDSRSKPKPPFRERKEAYIAKIPEALDVLHRRPGRDALVLSRSLILSGGWVRGGWPRS